MADDWQRLRDALNAAGVAGVHDLGHFRNPKYFEPSSFDGKSAMPVLIRLLPTLTDPNAAHAVAAHLAAPWARPSAFPALRDAFVAWATTDYFVGWQLGNAIGFAANEQHISDLLALAENPQFGDSRQMVVDCLWRFRAKDERIAPALLRLIDDPGVALHAMSALRRTIGNEAALSHLRRVAEQHPDDRVRQVAERQIKKASKAVSR